MSQNEGGKHHLVPGECQEISQAPNRCNESLEVANCCPLNVSSKEGCEKEDQKGRSQDLSGNRNVIMNLKASASQDSGESSSSPSENRHMPWFGLDIGGTLVKVVFFDPDETQECEKEILNRTRAYLKSARAYGTTGKRDVHLEMPCTIAGHQGTLHFIRFSTNQMSEFIKMAAEKGLADLIKDVCATGGGAYKFEEEIRTRLDIRFRKSDELDSVIYGIHFIEKYNPTECYYLEDPLNESKCRRKPYNFTRPYPYLVVNIGSGVSILAVYSPTSYSRVWGSSIGGGTFEGLCCSLTQSQISFDEAIHMAATGSASKVDKLVKDIYGGDYEKFNLRGDLVASSFGSMNNQDRRQQAKPEDFARGVLELVTLNIASIARLCAKNEKVDRVVFIGNFLRVNELSMKLLSYAVEYWSNGDMKALFLQHEGYFGAVGCLVESTQGYM